MPFFIKKNFSKETKMKKFIALFAVAILFSLNAYAADSWAGESVTGTYSANVYCLPTLSPSTQGPNRLGTFFTGSTAVPVWDWENIMAWTLTGPKEAKYDVGFGGTTFANSFTNNGATIYGEWSIDLGATTEDANLDDATLFTASNECPNSSGITIWYKADTIIPGQTPGTKTFTVTLIVSATI
jgi:hypothetical protein